MNVLFLGNGFDLFHKLPTKYINFLNTVDSLSKKNIDNISTVGNVFSDVSLNEKDKEIRESYGEYGALYDDTSIEMEHLKQLKSLSDKNLWFKYFSSSLKDDVTWIDFEKEIFTVILSFQELFKICIKTNVSLGKLNDSQRYIIKAFNFFLNPSTGSEIPTGAQPIKDEYLIETPIGSKNKIIDKAKIVNELSMQLNELAEALKLYLKFFIEKMVEKIPNTQGLQWKQAFHYTDYAITFNYTNTYELLYKKEEASHIHGNVNTKIVLGVNPDGADIIETVDTTFVPFKKYFQRIKYKTDITYLGFVEKNKNIGDLALYVIGHSLDITDKDIIQEAFSIAKKIFILSYDENDESKHISNLINIFGKSAFDTMRREKDISFMSISDDINAIMRENSEEEKNRKWSAAMSGFRTII